MSPSRHPRQEGEAHGAPRPSASQRHSHPAGHPGHARHAHGPRQTDAPAHNPQEAVDVARSVATLMERLRQLKNERDEARRENQNLRQALPEDHPLRRRADDGGETAMPSADADGQAARAAASAAVAGSGGVAGLEAVFGVPPAGEGGDVDSPEALRAELQQALVDKEEAINLARRVQAELDNYRKRVQRDMANMRREALRDFLQGFLGAFDDLDRVLAESAKDPAAATVRQGVSLVRDNLWRVMEKSGVKTIEAQGQPFDPRFHDAMTAVPSAEHPANTILEVFQPGYTLDDFVLRPSRVVVSSAPPSEPPAGDDAPKSE